MGYSEKQIQDWRARLWRTLPERRFHHSLAVCGEATKMARRWGLDEEKATIAGLLHDVARDLPFPVLYERAKQAGLPLSMAEAANPIILHAPVGALVLEQDWGIADADVLNAVRYHTVAAPEMDRFCQLIFLADLIEPFRKDWPDLEKVRSLCYADLDQAMYLALHSTFRYLRRKGQFIHPRAYKAYEFFKQCCTGGQE